MAEHLFALCRDRARVVHRLGDNQAALALYNRASETLDRLVDVEGRDERGNYLAEAYKEIADGEYEVGDNQAAVALYDRAIEIHKRQVNVEGGDELTELMADLYLKKANAVSDLGDNRAAVALYDQARRNLRTAGQCRGTRGANRCPG